MTRFEVATQHLLTATRAELRAELDRNGVDENDPLVNLIAVTGFSMDRVEEMLELMRGDDLRQLVVKNATDAAKNAAQSAVRRSVWLQGAIGCIALAAITAALWVSLDRYHAAGYDFRLTVEAAKLSKTASDAGLLRFAADNADQIRWLQSDDGQRLMRISELYPGSRGGAQFPCFAPASREYRVGDQSVNACVVLAD